MNLITLDFETFYSQDYSLSKMTMVDYIMSPAFKVHGAVVKNGNSHNGWYSAQELVNVFSEIDWGNTLLLCHNTAFDAAILWWRYGVKPKRYLDTLSMSRALYGVNLASHSLDSLANHLGVGSKVYRDALSNTKGYRDLSPEQEEALARYCVMDVDLTIACFNEMKKTFPKGEYPVVDWVVRAGVEPVFMADTVALRAAHAAEVERKENYLANAGIDKADINSSARFAALLQPLLDAHEIPMPTKVSVKTGKTSFAFAKTDTDFVQLAEHEDERIALLVSARLGTKGSTVETKTKAMAHNAELCNGWWPVGLNYSGAQQTHRFSGSSIAGSAPQNLPRDGALRESIIAPPGHIIIAADLSQIELRIGAYLANERSILNMLAANGDVYSHFAGKIYGRVIDKKVDKDERQVGKVAVLSLGYAAGAGAFKKMLFAQASRIVTLEFAQEVVGIYRNTYMNYGVAWKACEGILKQWAGGETFVARQLDYSARGVGSYDGWADNGMRYETVSAGLATSTPHHDGLHLPASCVVGFQEITLPSGLKLKYPGTARTTHYNEAQEKTEHGFTFSSQDRKKSFFIEKERRQRLYGALVFENICQALAREVMTSMMLELDKKGWRAGLQVHDELVFVVPEDKLAEAMVDISTTMGRPVAWWPDLPLGVETGYGQSYGKIKKMTHQQVMERFK